MSSGFLRRGFLKLTSIEVYLGKICQYYSVIVNCLKICAADSKNSIDKRHKFIGFTQQCYPFENSFSDLPVFGNSINSGLIRRISRGETAD